MAGTLPWLYLQLSSLKSTSYKTGISLRSRPILSRSDDFSIQQQLWQAYALLLASLLHFTFWIGISRKLPANP